MYRYGLQIKLDLKKYEKKQLLKPSYTLSFIGSLQEQRLISKEFSFVSKNSSLFQCFTLLFAVLAYPFKIIHPEN
jgi:hypothetical protein